MYWVDADSGEICNRRFTRQALIEFLANRPAGRVALEACGSGHWWARKIEALGHEVMLIHAKFIRPLSVTQLGQPFGHGIRCAVLSVFQRSRWGSSDVQGTLQTAGTMQALNRLLDPGAGEVALLAEEMKDGPLALYRAAQAHAAIRGRAYVLPDDVKAQATAVLRHRLFLIADAQMRGRTGAAVVSDVLARTPVPAEDDRSIAGGEPPATPRSIAGGEPPATPLRGAASR